MTLEQIYSDFTRGSNGFVKAVQTWGGMDLSDAEIERIAARAETAEEFRLLWGFEDFWTDVSN